MNTFPIITRSFSAGFKRQSLGNTLFNGAPASFTGLRSFTTTAQSPAFTWKDFFVHRKSRIRWETFGGAVGLGIGLFAGSSYFLLIADFDVRPINSAARAANVWSA
jgi:hypothetical protein